MPRIELFVVMKHIGFVKTCKENGDWYELFPPQRLNEVVVDLNLYLYPLSGATHSR